MEVPDFMRSMPLEAAHPARLLVRDLESTLAAALPPSLGRLHRVKAEAARAFALALQRLASLTHLARAARAVLKNPAQCELLAADWAALDLVTVHEAVASVCGCSVALMTERTCQSHHHHDRGRYICATVFV
jgi:hypothetical protein